MKNIVLCCDGTWNDALNEDDGHPAPTNVRKIFEAVDLTSLPVKQLSRYQAGVGTEGGIDKLAGGLLGIGLAEDIKDCYQWLSDKFAPGDRLYLFGFSRGAYTARSLAGMIGQFGLLSFSGTSGIGRSAQVQKVYQAYREKSGNPSDLTFHDDSKEVYFVGVWDTVGALGIPDDKAIADIVDNPDKHRFHDTKLGVHIVNGRHAVAIDEKRGSFSPTLWTNNRTDDTIKQQWFPGVHSDVGGGYKETGLSDCALKWMLDEIATLTYPIQFKSSIGQVQPDPHGLLHESYEGAMKILRTVPRAMPNLDTAPTISHYAKARRENPPVSQGLYRETRQFSNGQCEIDIYAKHRWYWTGLYLEAGTYQFDAEGEWIDSTITCPPSGTNDGNFQFGEIVQIAASGLGYLERAWNAMRGKPVEQDWLGYTKRHEAYPWFALTGVVANHSNPNPDGTYLPPETFLIGDSATYTVAKSGYLYCYANDAWNLYGNNRGYVTLTVQQQ